MGTGDGTLGLNDSRLTSSMRDAQHTIFEYVTRSVRSTTRMLPFQEVDDKVESVSVHPLGFLDAADLASQIRLLAAEEISP